MAEPRLTPPGPRVVPPKRPKHLPGEHRRHPFKRRPRLTTSRANTDRTPTGQRHGPKKLRPRLRHGRRATTARPEAPEMAPTSQRYRFGPLEQRGLIGSVRTGQAVVIGAALSCAVAMLNVLPVGLNGL